VGPLEGVQIADTLAAAIEAEQEGADDDAAAGGE
jgi:hypothetical protein